MADTSEEKQERLSSIWSEWGLQPDTATGKDLRAALDAADTWLQKGASEPEIVLRAVQLLLIDPERPDAHKRPCWSSLRKAITGAWSNAMTAPDHVFFGQSLVLAAWPTKTEGPWFSRAPLLDSAWDVLAGRESQRDTITRWREGVRLLDQERLRRRSIERTPVNIAPYGAINLSSVTQGIQHLQQNHSQANFSTVGPQLAQVLTTFNSALSTLGDALQRMPEDMTAILTAVEEESQITNSLLFDRNALSLLWWGQARYCHTLQKPFRRIQPREDGFWWAAWEAAKAPGEFEVEPAAAYLVEMLHDLGQDVFEKRPLLQWMEELHASLKRAAQLAPALPKRLAGYVQGDALGLPVTWVRLRAARRESLEGAADAVALDLNAEIDRGQWASWIFRECLLSLYLHDPS